MSNHYTTSQIETMAEKTREKFAVNDGDKLNVVSIAKGLGFTVYNASFDNNKIAGKVVSDENEKSIYINKSDTPERKRFTVAHEIGHIVLHHPLDDSPFSKVDYRGANNTFDRKEWEANRFAAALLMPEEEARRVWRKTHDVDDFAEAMGVSKLAGAIRLEVLGLID